MWAKKGVVGKEDVAKLVDDTYRSRTNHISTTYFLVLALFFPLWQNFDGYFSCSKPFILFSCFSKILIIVIFLLNPVEMCSILISRKMQASGATDLATKGQNVLDINNVKIKMEDYFQSDRKIRCPCGNSLETESMIKCVDPRCEVWQHVGCVLVPEKFVDDDPQLPDLFYCEICRLSRADPFWVSVAHPLYPVKLATTNIPSDG
uniref:Uncharacterized protein MANES_11G142100 n=1 Tax=Rhizophora mucronata TaxID=61149 RepID=A0A2P2MH64_RHIMU